VADEGDLRGLDPFDQLNREAERLDRFFAALDDSRWDDPSRCDGWTVRDVLAHLAATENYHHACLDDTLSAFVQDGLDAGASDLDGFNEWGLRAYEGRDPAAILDEWRAANAQTRRRMRGRDGETMTTMVPGYPVRLQAFHLASELATHADDVGAPVDPRDVAARTKWRAQFSRFAIAEAERDVDIEPTGGANRVQADDAESVLSDAELVEATADRLPPDHPLPVALRTTLSIA
jgi:uncharacterized protein (TIGR03083 family)